MNESAKIYAARYKLPDMERVLKVLTAYSKGREPMSLVYEWTVSRVINLKEFKGLMNMILMEEIEFESDRSRTMHDNAMCWIDEGD